MKALSDANYNALNALEQEFDKQLQADILEMIEDGETIDLNLNCGNTFYKTISRQGDEVWVSSDYTDDSDGLIYEDEEEDVLAMPLYEMIPIHNHLFHLAERKAEA